MKKTKKIMAIALTVLMLMSAGSLNAFAGFAFWEGPKVESVVFTDSQSISLKEVENYYEDCEEYLAESEEEYDEFPEYLYFELGYSAFDYSIEITMSDGTKFAIDAGDGYTELGRVYILETRSYVSYDEYLRVAESGEDTVEVVTEAYLYNVLFDDYVREEAEIFKSEKNLMDCFVKSITEISGLPSEFCEYSDYYEIDGAEFLVEYADGKKETYTLETEIKGFLTDYKLNEIGVRVYENNGKLIVEYYDARCEKEITYIEEPFESIEITECLFDEENLALTSVSYKINRINGESETYTYTPGVLRPVFLSEVIERTDGFNVYLNVLPFEINYESGEINYDKFTVSVSVGSEATDSYEIESPYAGTLNAVDSVTAFISKIVSFFRNIISYIVNMLFSF